MVFDSESTSIVMYLPELIKRSYIPKDNDPPHLPTIIGEKREIALLGFIKLGLKEQEG